MSQGGSPRPDGDRERCRILRDDGLTVREIAEATGIPRSTVGDYVKGRNPDTYTARVIDRRLEAAELYLTRPDLTVRQIAARVYGIDPGPTNGCRSLYGALDAVGVPHNRAPGPRPARERAREREDRAARVASR